MGETPGDFDSAILTTEAIMAARGDRHPVPVDRPYAFFVEPERAAHGGVVEVATLFLSNSECPFRCLMCDLWRHTLDGPTPPGVIPQQMRFALTRLKPATHLKLYNSGNFFDRRAIPEEDWPEIAQLARPFAHVTVENHPRLCDDRCLRFKSMLAGRFEIALGLETIHPTVLPRLNKEMTVDDFDRAVERLLAGDIAVRAFILLRPPFLSEVEGVEWALKSIDHAFSRGVTCCAVIPTRAGNGIMEQLQAQGHFSSPRLSSLETVLTRGLAMKRGRVFVDLWDARRFAECPHCAEARIQRLNRMNLSQAWEAPVRCRCEARP